MVLQKRAESSLPGIAEVWGATGRCLVEQIAASATQTSRVVKTNELQLKVLLTTGSLNGYLTSR